MPITIRTPIRHLSQEQFGEVAYRVMRCVFEIHRDFGRLFDEKIYKRELFHRYPGVQLEVPIEITHGSFRKVQYIDVLIDNGAPFEFKTVDAINPRHAAQLLHYLLLAGLSHGKLVNLRKDSVEHEFVNTTLTRDDRIHFETADFGWAKKIIGAEHFREVLIAVLRDWGTGLDLQLYEEAMTHLLGGEAHVVADVEVRSSAERVLGRQKLKLASPRVAFVVTTLTEGRNEYENHTRRLLRHTDLDAILWANIGLKLVTFTAIT